MWYFESIVSATPYMNVGMRLGVTSYLDEHKISQNFTGSVMEADW